MAQSEVSRPPKEVGRSKFEVGLAVDADRAEVSRVSTRTVREPDLVGNYDKVEESVRSFGVSSASVRIALLQAPSHALEQAERCKSLAHAGNGMKILWIGVPVAAAPVILEYGVCFHTAVSVYSETLVSECFLMAANVTLY